MACPENESGLCRHLLFLCDSQPRRSVAPASCHLQPQYPPAAHHHRLDYHRTRRRFEQSQRPRAVHGPLPAHPIESRHPRGARLARVAGGSHCPLRRAARQRLAVDRLRLDRKTVQKCALPIFYRHIQLSPAIRVVPASRALLEEAIALYAARPDKDWPLTDCVSFVVMRDEGITQALTGDQHFEQAGFTALLK